MEKATLLYSITVLVRGIQNFIGTKNQQLGQKVGVKFQKTFKLL